MPGAPPAAAQDFYFGHWLRDLPAGSNLFAFLESTQPEITTDRFNSGGLNAGEPERVSAFLASWSQTEYRIDGISISSPIDGTPMLFPELAWWNRIDVATGVMPAWTKATSLSIAVETPAASDRWTGTFELVGTGGVLAQDASASRPAAIARLDASTGATALVSGRLMERLGLLIGGAWTRASVTERRRSSRRNETGSAFASATFSISPQRTVRAVAWAHSRRPIRSRCGGWNRRRSVTDARVHAPPISRPSRSSSAR